MLRLRQIALVAHDLDATEAQITDALGVQLCYRDPGVGVFGLRNALFPIGDQFLEVVSPTEEGTTAGRLLDKRGGDCGYMAIFQVDALEPVETRLAELGTRIVFDARGENVRGLHLHPKDVPGAIVSIDASDEPSEWPWAGSAWREHVSPTASAITAVTVAVDDPQHACATWADVLGVDIEPGAQRLSTDDAVIRFRASGAGAHGITEVELDVADGRLDHVREIAGVTFSRAPNS